MAIIPSLFDKSQNTSAGSVSSGGNVIPSLFQEGTNTPVDPSQMTTFKSATPTPKVVAPKQPNLLDQIGNFVTKTLTNASKVSLSNVAKNAESGVITALTTHNIGKGIADFTTREAANSVGANPESQKEVLKIGSNYATNTFKDALNTVEGAGKLTPVYMLYRAVTGNPVKNDEYIKNALKAGGGALNTAFDLNPEVKVPLNLGSSALKYTRQNINNLNFEDYKKALESGVTNGPSLGEAVTDNQKLASVIDLVFTVAMVAEPVIGSKLNSLNANAKSLNEVADFLNVKADAPMSEVASAWKEKLKDLSSTFTSNPDPIELEERVKLNQAYETLQKAGVIDKKYAVAYDYFNSRMPNPMGNDTPLSDNKSVKELPSGNESPQNPAVTTTPSPISGGVPTEAQNTVNERGGGVVLSNKPEVGTEITAPAKIELGKTPEVPEAPTKPGDLKQANAGLNPNVDKFIKEDVSRVATHIQKVGKELSDVVNPPNGSSKARVAADLIREQKAIVANKATIEARQMKDTSNYFKKFTDEQNVANISSYERTGKFENAPEGYSDLYKRSMEASRAIMQQVYGEDKVGFVENYVRRSFQFASTADELKGTNFLLNNTPKSLGPSKSPLKSRVLKMPIDEALKNMQDRGIHVKMATSNPELLRQWSMTNAQKALAFNTTLEKAIDTGLIKFIKSGEDVPEDLVPADDRAFKSFYPDGKSFAERGNFYGDPHVMRIFNNAVSRGLEGSQVANTYSALRTVKNTLNQFNLGLSAFHLTETGLNASMMDLSNAARNILEGKPLEAAKKIARAGVPFASLSNNVWRGYKFMKAIEVNDPTAWKILNEQVNKGGARLGITNEYRTAMVDKMNEALTNGNYLGGLVRLPSAVIDYVSAPIMEFIVPYNKLGAYLDKAAQIAERLPADARDEQIRHAYTSAQSSNDNIFGQMVYDNLFWNKTFKDILQITTRSVGWSAGTLGEFGGAGKDIINTVRGKTGAEFANGSGKIPLGERFSDRTLNALMLPILAGTMGAIYMYLHTGKGPGELKDYFYPKDGGKDKSGNDTRASLPTYMKDLFSYGADPVGTLVNKSSGLLSTVSDLLSNKDYYGNLVRNPNDPTGTQLSQVGEFLINSILPFSITQLEQTASDTMTSGERKVEGFFGLLRAPQKYTESQQQLDTFKASENIRGLPGPKTPEEVKINNLKNKARDELNSGISPNDSKSYQELIKDGTLNTKLKQDNFIKSSSLTPVERVQKTLPKVIQQLQNGKTSDAGAPNALAGVGQVLQDTLSSIGSEFNFGVKAADLNELAKTPPQNTENFLQKAGRVLKGIFDSVVQSFNTTKAASETPGASPLAVAQNPYKLSDGPNGTIRITLPTGATKDVKDYNEQKAYLAQYQAGYKQMTGKDWPTYAPNWIEQSTDKGKVKGASTVSASPPVTTSDAPRNPKASNPSPNVNDAITRAASYFNVPPSFLKDVAFAESSYNSKEVNTTKAGKDAGNPTGLFQFTDGTWNDLVNTKGDYGKSLRASLPNTDRTDPYTNALAAAYLISHGQLDKWAASEWNWGNYWSPKELESKGFYAQSPTHIEGHRYSVDHPDDK